MLVEIEQYCMTKDTAEFSTNAMACREYTQSRDEEASEPEGQNRGNTQIGPVSETICLHGKYGVEIRVTSVNKKKFSLMGQNFSWLDQVGHELEHQRIGNFRSAVRRICVEIDSE